MNEFEIRFLKEIQERGRKTYSFWYFLSTRAMWFFILYFLVLWTFSDFDFKYLFFIFLSVAMTFIVTFLLRRVIKRPRPKSESNYIPKLNRYSFPSIHTSTSFSFAISLGFLSFWLFDEISLLMVIAFLFLLVLAMLIGISRIVVGVHYLSDIISGALLGSLITLLIFLM